jgi:hypothetical protein
LEILTDKEETKSYVSSGPTTNNSSTTPASEELRKYRSEAQLAPPKNISNPTQKQGETPIWLPTERRNNANIAS